MKAHEQELRTSGVLGLSLFGSVARGEDSVHDVDVAVRLSENFPAPDLNYLSCLSELEGRLSGILGCKVDVIEEPVGKKRFQTEIDRAPLPSDKPARRLEDIIENAGAIQRYVASTTSSGQIVRSGVGSDRSCLCERRKLP